MSSIKDQFDRPEAMHARPSTPQPILYTEAGRENRYEVEMRKTKTFMDQKKEACCCLVREQDEALESNHQIQAVKCHCSEKVNGITMQLHIESHSSGDKKG